MQPPPLTYRKYLKSNKNGKAVDTLSTTLKKTLFVTLKAELTQVLLCTFSAITGSGEEKNLSFKEHSKFTPKITLKIASIVRRALA